MKNLLLAVLVVGFIISAQPAEAGVVGAVVHKKQQEDRRDDREDRRDDKKDRKQCKKSKGKKGKQKNCN